MKKKENVKKKVSLFIFSYLKLNVFWDSEVFESEKIICAYILGKMTSEPWATPPEMNSTISADRNLQSMYNK